MSTSLQQLAQLRRRVYAGLIFSLLLLIAALLLVSVDFRLTLIIFAAAILCQLLPVRSLKKRYVSAVTQANLEQTVCRYLDAGPATEAANERLTAATLREAGLMPFREGKNMPLLRWEVSGQRNGYAITLCDATLTQDYGLGGDGKNRMHFNSGVWAHITLPQDCGKRFLLYDDAVMPTAIRTDFFAGQPSLEAVRVAEPELGEYVTLYRPAGQYENDPPDSLLRSLRRLVKYTPGYVALGVRGDQLDVFIHGRFLAESVSILRKPTKELLDFNPLPELSYLIDLAGSLR
ncbi:MAG: hypothetical protein LUE86_12260 [Clostridiales bacterium]|nr:hypothetical protein [Clostridiales bacterium]